MPQISVIVPVYKVEKYIHRCVDSILAQTFTDFELILVDDGSPDNCPAICDEYAAKDSRIHVIHQENGGLSAARNAGIDWVFSNSDSEWISFVDSDDWVHPQFLKLLYRGAIEQSAKISMCQYALVSEPIPFENIKTITSFSLSPGDAYIYNCKSIAAYFWIRIYNREVFMTGLRFPKGKLWEDLFLAYKVLYSVDKVAVVPAKLYYYYKNTEGIVHSNWAPSKLDQLEAYTEQIPFFIALGEQVIIERIIRAYINCIHQNYVLIEKSSYMHKDLYRNRLKKEMRKTIRSYSKLLGLSIGRDAHFYEIAYPKLMELYWYWQALLKKLHIKR